MKKLSLLVAALAVCSLAVAQKPADKKVKTEAECPVMKGAKVNIAKATKTKMYADYKGRRYFLCCAGCPGAFKANPEKFAKGADSIPIPKTVKKTVVKKKA